MAVPFVRLLVVLFLYCSRTNNGTCIVLLHQIKDLPAIEKTICVTGKRTWRLKKYTDQFTHVPLSQQKSVVLRKHQNDLHQNNKNR